MAESNYLYAHGSPISEKVLVNLDDQMERVHKKFAGLILIDGSVGQGKTTLMVECLDHLNKKPINFKEQLGMGGVDFSRKLKESYIAGRNCLGYDEAGDFDKRGAVSNFNRFINRIFDTYRAFKILPVMALPRFWVLDQTIFDKGIPRLLLHVHHRNEHYGNISGYSLVGMHWLKYWADKLVIKSQCYDRVEPNFVGHFLNLPPERERELDRYSTGGKFNVLEEEEVKYEGLITLNDISRSVGRSTVWTQRFLKTMKVKPKKVWKNRYYFDKDVVDHIIMSMGKK